jgi:hypothetical protein
VPRERFCRFATSTARAFGPGGTDTLEWNGTREIDETYLETGSLQITGAPTPRYVVVMRYAMYTVTRTPDGAVPSPCGARGASGTSGASATTRAASW